jgi:hypothetical protein
VLDTQQLSAAITCDPEIVSGTPVFAGTIELKLDLPDSLANEVKANGLLTPEAIESLQAEIRRRRVGKLFEAAECLAALDMPVSETEVEAEIAAVRQLYGVYGVAVGQ